MSTGSTRSVVAPSSPGGNVVSVMVSEPYSSWVSALNVKETNVFGVAGDEATARLDVLAHQHGEQFVGRRSVVQRDPTQHPRTRIHGGLPQLLRVHLAETLVALNSVLGVDLSASRSTRLQQSVPLAVRVGELGFATLPLQLLQRRLCEQD